MRVIRQKQAIIYDPVLNEYIKEPGYRLPVARNVQTPFYFFLMGASEINAFAFFWRILSL